MNKSITCVSEPADFSLIERNPDFVVIHKAPGVDVHRDGDEPGLPEKVAAALGVDKVWLVHRLDKVTSGLMLLALNAAVCAELSELFRSRQIEKYYLAVSDRKPVKKQGRIAGDMQRSRRGSWKLLPGKSNPAVTQFFSCSVQPGIRAFLLKPLTGKTHQLRVALKSLSAPICGDSLYHGADAAREHERTYLHAFALSFFWRGEHLKFQVLPDSGELFLSAAFQQALVPWAQPWDLPWPSGK